MRQKTISLNTINKARKLRDVACEYDIDMDVKHERTIVDAKSFMGIMSLDLAKPVILVLHTDNDELADSIFERIKDLWC